MDRIPWDYQYELIADHPMRLNALLQSSGYHIDCYSGGLMLANTSGNDFSKCVYEGYNRKIQAYKISARGNVHHITNRDGSLTKERLERFKTMLARQRTGDTTTFKAIETSAAELEMYEFYSTI
ncbi:hypothetical protein C0J26_11755 [Pseudomonas baetica]|nr:hypothetical protein C0J26_11755 [Pseudomonas baetica]